MKTIFKCLTAAAIFSATLAGCAVYVPGPRYRYAEPPPVVVVPGYGYRDYGRRW